MSNQANKSRQKTVGKKQPLNSVSEIEPNDYRTRDEFKDACQTVLDFLLRTDSRTIGAVSRYFRDESFSLQHASLRF